MTNEQKQEIIEAIRVQDKKTKQAGIKYIMRHDDPDINVKINLREKWFQEIAYVTGMIDIAKIMGITEEELKENGVRV